MFTTTEREMYRITLRGEISLASVKRYLATDRALRPLTITRIERALRDLQMEHLRRDRRAAANENAPVKP